ncbi:hypothetical protein TVAG_076030 [Trichomonas vaginalis G3]|uniref:Uncharacterized protein n=1 Tax=Trichomonas vaginalis (strain ATCC PRA-98 / G3) TaxID=412133 RepID=A2D9K0_TRIV3|nr:hypothetical protein TVAGG3_0293130 [Trichomonas vaginalis G3]EAY22856.1 hypothetical protein TVAG_076030 [Trichomonas vaginalis G3]KAI5527430.1 hypothetical protein TVAGG3_0293130 [Trichomonas vaginalis G3]|eukprot:XP_001583842.1 hypothetical protein [Trichomonas vaginalis G3]
MSVREKPAANRYLLMKEQEDAYSKHMKALADARPTINTTQPPLSGRLRELQKKNAENRRRMIQGMEKKEKMLDRTQNKTRTPKKFEIRPQTARPKQDIYDDIDLFKQDTDKYKAPTSRIPLIRQPDYTSSSDEIKDPSSFDSDISDSEGIDMGSSENYYYKPEHESENIRFGYGKNFVETDSTTESTSLISTSNSSKKHKSSSTAARTESSTGPKKERVPLVKSSHPTDAETFLTSTDVDDPYKQRSGRESGRKSNIAQPSEPKKPENSTSLSAVIRSKLDSDNQARDIKPPEEKKEEEKKAEEKKEEEKLSSSKSDKKKKSSSSSSSSSSSISSPSSSKLSSSSKHNEKAKEEPEKEKSPEEKHEEDLFSSDFGDSDSDSASSKKSGKQSETPKEEEKKEPSPEKKKSASGDNFESDDDLELPDF